MQPVVETLAGLERRIEISVLLADVEKAVQAELKRVSRTAKAPGFRPGKVPMAMLERTHSAGIRYDMINNKVGQGFEQAIEASGLRMAGSPKLEPKTEDTPEGTLAFYAVFEIYPEITLPDLSALKIKRAVTTVGDAEVQSTVNILRKQRAEYAGRDDRVALDEDRVTLDFVGTIDGVPFDGGKAEDFPFVLGQGRMLPEFEVAVRGLKAGESKVFSLAFPADYGGKDVAGKTAEFTITVKEVAEPVLPVIDAEFAKSLGQPEGDVEKLLADIRGNIEREVKARALVLDEEERDLGAARLLQEGDDGLAAELGAADDGEHLLVLAAREREWMLSAMPEDARSCSSATRSAGGTGFGSLGVTGGSGFGGVPGGSGVGGGVGGAGRGVQISAAGCGSFAFSAA
jgi:trigger factor